MKIQVNIKIKRALCAAVWVAALCACILLADRALRRDDSERKYAAFYEEEQDFDVLFMGTSRVLDGVQPLELWRDYGITSYNMGNNSEPLDMTEWVLRMALEEQSPEVVVIDVYYIGRAIDEAWTYSYRHLFLDSTRLSPLKIQAVTSTLPRDQWMEFLFPLSLYHGRWEEILSGDTAEMVACKPYMMGAELRPAREDWIEGYTYTTEMNETDMPGKDALRRMVQLCREKGVEPVFMALWAPISEEEQKNVNSVQLIADELGVPFVNMLGETELFDYKLDCCDYQGHLNPDGAAKATAYLGEWLSSHFDLADKRGDAAYAHWDENLALYEAYREEIWGGMTRLD